MTKMMTKVSVIMPSLNVAEYIEECMDSIIGQTLNDIEIICIDAGSTDGTWEILEGYKNAPAYGNKIRLYHSDIKSYGYQVNLGIKLARGDYIAVMETDDFADDHMYKDLVETALLNDADAVRANCKWFWTDKNGQRYYIAHNLWSRGDKRYNTMLDPGLNAYLYEQDYSLWKGIYKREFIIKNKIWLNETYGASYQDIGFMMKFFTYAEKVFYLDRSFYRYRCDRENSSTSSMHSLHYAKQEFETLMDDPGFWNKVRCKQGVYRRMASSFMAEYAKALTMAAYDTDSAYLSADYGWFCMVLNTAIKRSEFNIDYMPNSTREDFELLLNDYKSYASKVKERNDLYRKKMDPYLKIIGSRELIIFGAGTYGKNAIQCFLNERIKPVVIFDNNEKLWGEAFLNISIVKPEHITENQCVIIAAKYHGAEIVAQLKDMGVQADQIMFWRN